MNSKLSRLYRKTPKLNNKYSTKLDEQKNDDLDTNHHPLKYMRGKFKISKSVNKTSEDNQLGNIGNGINLKNNHVSQINSTNHNNIVESNIRNKSYDDYNSLAMDNENDDAYIEAANLSFQSNQAIINTKRLKLQEEYIRLQNMDQNAITFLDNELDKLKTYSKEKLNKPPPTNNKNDDTLNAVLCVKTYNDLPGIENAIDHINRVISFLKDKDTVNYFKIPISKGIILNGSTGCGKSSLIEAIANENKLVLYRVYATQFMNALTGQSEKYIKKIFKYAMDCKNDCLLLIEGVDILFKKNGHNSIDSLEERIIHQIASCMDELTTNTYMNPNNNNLVCVVINTCHISSIDSILRRSGRFEHEVHIGIPNLVTREAILKSILRNVPMDIDVDIAMIAQITPGYAASDLGALIRGAVINAYNRNKRNTRTIIDNNSIDENNCQHFDSQNSMVSVDSSNTILNSLTTTTLNIQQTDLINASKIIKPASMKEGFTDVTGVTWNDIGALHNVRNELRLQLLGPIIYKELFDKFGYTPSTGILLFGPPGCGKTMVAKALASEAGLNFISVRGPEIISMYVGESEKSIRDIFSQAQNSSPCVIFFDEIDSICVKRSDSTNDNNSSARVVNQLLTEMDGLVKRENVYILAATNRPDILDPAVLRPGRFDKMIYIGLPNEIERLSILKTVTKDGTCPTISMKLMEEIVKLTNNYSGADIVAFIRECTLIALKSLINFEQQPSNSYITNHNYASINSEHIHAAINKMKSSISSEDLIKYTQMKMKYSNCIN